jgi:hypothetical protein
MGYIPLTTFRAAKIQILAVMTQMNAASFGKINLTKRVLNHDIVYFAGRLIRACL